MAGWRRARIPAVIAFIISLPAAYAGLRFRLDNPSDAHIRALKFMRRHSKPYHD